MPAPRSIFLAAILTLGPLAAQQPPPATDLRQFTTHDGKTFSAAVLGKNDLAVFLALPTGLSSQMSIRDLSSADQLFVRRWSKFKDDLRHSPEFARLTVQDLLEMRGYQSFAFTLENNHLLIAGELNGKPARFLVDSAADSSVLHLASAREAGLEVGPLNEFVFGLGGKAPAGVCRVPSLHFGNAILENRKLLATDLFKDATARGNYDAIFGADFLTELEAVISFREARLFLKITAPKPGAPPAGAPRPALPAPAVPPPPTPTPAASANPWREQLARNPEWRTLSVKEVLELRGYQSLAYRTSSNHLLVDGQIGQTKATFLIDTGAYRGVLHLDFAKKVGLAVGPMDQSIFGLGGRAPAGLTKVPSLKMGGILIENRTLLSADLFKDAGLPGGTGPHDALLGAEFLRELDAVLSYQESRLFLRPDPTAKLGASAAPEIPNK